MIQVVLLSVAQIDFFIRQLRPFLRRPILHDHQDTVPLYLHATRSQGLVRLPVDHVEPLLQNEIRPRESLHVGDSVAKELVFGYVREQLFLQVLRELGRLVLPWYLHFNDFPQSPSIGVPLAEKHVE